MATTEQNGLMTYKDAAGNKYLLYPITKAENVDGIENFPRLLTPTGTSILTWAAAQTVSGYFSFGTAFTDAPAASWYSGFLEVVSATNKRLFITDRDNATHKTYVNMQKASGWTGWTDLSDALTVGGKARADIFCDAGQVTDKTVLEAVNDSVYNKGVENGFIHIGNDAGIADAPAGWGTIYYFRTPGNMSLMTVFFKPDWSRKLYMRQFNCGAATWIDPDWLNISTGGNVNRMTVSSTEPTVKSANDLWIW